MSKVSKLDTLTPALNNYKSYKSLLSEMKKKNQSEKTKEPILNKNETEKDTVQQ